MDNSVASLKVGSDTNRLWGTTKDTPLLIMTIKAIRATLTIPVGLVDTKTRVAVVTVDVTLTTITTNIKISTTLNSMEGTVVNPTEWLTTDTVQGVWETHTPCNIREASKMKTIRKDERVAVETTPSSRDLPN
jgi:hypothetical protein